MGYFGRANFSKFATEYTTVQEARDLYITQYNMDRITSENGSNLQNRYPILTDERVTNDNIGNSLSQAIIDTEKIKEITDKNVELYKVDMKLLNLDIKNEYVINIKTGVLYKREGVKYQGRTYHNLEGVESLPDETGNSLIDLSVVINQETDTMYKCLLTFKATDENDKIKQIEYLPKVGEAQIVVSADEEEKQEIPINYDIEKTDVDKTFRVTTVSGNVELVNTAYTVTYDNNMGEVFKEDKILKGSITTISIPNLAPTKEGKHFIGWSKYKISTEPDYFENGEYTVNNKNITFYAIWIDEQNGKTEDLNNDSLLGKVSKINTSGVQNIEVNGVTYSANIIVENNDLVLDGEKQVTGATIVDKVYEFGNKETDVAKENDDGTVTDAQNMVILKVNGNLTVNYHTTLTACKSDNGYGGPKGLLVYCTGTLSNNGTIDMTARGARAEGQNVYLWKNRNNSYEYVPENGAIGGESISRSINKYGEYERISGLAGDNGTNRSTGGGGGGSISITYQSANKTTVISGKGTDGTSYSGGSGGGGIDVHRNGTYSAWDAEVNAGCGGDAYATRDNTSWTSRHAGGGAGNPGGAGKLTTSGKVGANYLAYAGESGTGGLLMLYANTLNNEGKILSNGSKGGAARAGGGSSGGGSINIFAQTIIDYGKKEANGGEATGLLEALGGAGGNGSITMGNIATGTFVKENE